MGWNCLSCNYNSNCDHGNVEALLTWGCSCAQQAVSRCQAWCAHGKCGAAMSSLLCHEWSKRRNRPGWDLWKILRSVSWLLEEVLGSILKIQVSGSVPNFMAPLTSLFPGLPGQTFTVRADSTFRQEGWVICCGEIDVAIQ